MKLEKLVKNLKIIKTKGNLSVEILSLSQKVEKCKENSLFFCYKGVNFDAHDYALQAQKNGAVALVVERFLDIDLPQILVKNTRTFMAKVCNIFYRKDIKNLKFVGITGTNGKTTTATLIYNILVSSGKNVGLIGTNGVCFADKKINSSLTTPDIVDLFELLTQMKDNGIEYVVMEVSAHAIDLKKIEGIKFEVGVFSNLTQDHLDYFKTMHNYALTKLKFLQKKYCKNVIINTDDDYGKLFMKLSNSNKFSCGIKDPAQNFAMDIKTSFYGTKCLINVFDSVLEVTSNLIGIFNVYNILSACACAKILGVDLDFIYKGILNTKQVDGRMNYYFLKNGSIVVIDYAHTPDGLQKVLETLNNLKQNKRIITVFGCGGNRDKQKRPLMGQIACLLSDQVIVTSDNPRWEDKMQIIKDITKGISLKNFVVEEDRKKAIQKAIEISKNGDIILIAGKGAEDYQEVNGIKNHFSDYEQLTKYVRHNK